MSEDEVDWRRHDDEPQARRSQVETLDGVRSEKVMRKACEVNVIDRSQAVDMWNMIEWTAQRTGRLP